MRKCRAAVDVGVSRLNTDITAALKEFPKAESEPGTQKGKEEIHLFIISFSHESFFHSFTQQLIERRKLSEMRSLWRLEAKRVGHRSTALDHSGKGRGSKNGEGDRVHKGFKIYFKTFKLLDERRYRFLLIMTQFMLYS